MLVNKDLAGKKVATEFGDITFNENGECTDLTIAQQKKLGALIGFSYVEDAKKAEPKKEEPKKEEAPAPKKPATRSRAKKTVAKEEEK